MSVQNVVVVGGSPSAWLAACVLRRAFRHRDLDVLVVDPGASADAPSGRWTLPSLRGLHALVGINENDFLRQTGASYKLAVEHCDWQGPGSHFVHAHAEIGTGAETLPFYKYLLAQRLHGRAANPEDYSVGAAAARAGKFARPLSDGPALAKNFTYAFHLGEAAYLAYVRAHAAKLGVRHIAGTVAEVALREDGGIDAVILEDGARVTGGFFIDCSGAKEVLMQRLPSSGIDDWSQWLPCDRMWSGLATALPEPKALTTTVATDAGWTWSAPLANGRIAGYVYSSAIRDDDAAMRELSAAVGGQEISAPSLRTLRSGRRREFWVKNCVALADTAVTLEPLAGADLHLAQLGIVNFVELFPLGAGAVEAVEYNRLMGEHADALRDFTLAHYRLNRRAGSFWNSVRAKALPDRLAHKLDLFAASGRIILLDQESFEEVDWAWVLLGSGLTPAALELQTRTLLDPVTDAQVAPMRATVQQLVASMPRHIDYLSRQGPARP
ncbi:MAG TPA: tryptophan halogenase family protein [Steroidobacteraceae bacterium]